MTTRLSALSLLVADYDQAIAWFTGVLGFELLEDADLGAGKRWVKVAPKAGLAGGGTALLLARASTPEQAAVVGRQGGGRVWLFLATDAFEADHAAMTARGVRFLEAPRREPYGAVAVFEDLYGNRWDLIESLS
jgi:catechol 2,3-dioxygenase-like lactoylglutathione lyase family enzyme